MYTRTYVHKERDRERGAGAEFVHKTICILLISSKDILNEIIVDMGLFNNTLLYYVCLKTNFNIVEIYLINNNINDEVHLGKSTYPNYTRSPFTYLSIYDMDWRDSYRSYLSFLSGPYLPFAVSLYG